MTSYIYIASQLFAMWMRHDINIVRLKCSLTYFYLYMRLQTCAKNLIDFVMAA